MKRFLLPIFIALFTTTFVSAQQEFNQWEIQSDEGDVVFYHRLVSRNYPIVIIGMRKNLGDWDAGDWQTEVILDCDRWGYSMQNKPFAAVMRGGGVPIDKSLHRFC